MLGKDIKSGINIPDSASLAKSAKDASLGIFIPDFMSLGQGVLVVREDFDTRKKQIYSKKFQKVTFIFHIKKCEHH